METDIKGDTSGTFKMLLVSLVQVTNYITDEKMTR